MKSQENSTCGQCRIRDAKIAALEEKVAHLEELVTRLEQKLASSKKNSSTSSKPPSSDIVKPKPPLPDGQKRSIGGQPGHPKHEREPFPPEQVTHFEEHLLEACPCCGGRLRRNGHLARVVQQIDIERPPLT